MERSHVFGIEIANRLHDMIEDWLVSHEEANENDAVQNLLNVCNRIITKAEEWPDEKLFMRLGFIQGVMVSHGVCSLDMIRRVVNFIRERHLDYVDLLDHNDPESPFNFELGGEG